MKSRILTSVLGTLLLGALAAGCATTSTSPAASTPDAEPAAKACACCKGPCKCGHKTLETAEGSATGGSGAMASGQEEGTQGRACAMSGCACGKHKS